MSGVVPSLDGLKGVHDYYINHFSTKADYEDIEREVEEAKEIAKGRATGYVFDTVEDMNTWLNDEDNKSKLNLGDNLYIRAIDVPDYWWDGNDVQQLETQKVDLTDYVKRTVDSRATNTQLGVIMVNPTYGITTSAEGYLMGSARTSDQVASNSGTMVLNVGTARNCAEEWTFTLADGTTVTKNVFVVPPKG